MSELVFASILIHLCGTVYCSYLVILVGHYIGYCLDWFACFSAIFNSSVL